MAERLYAGLTSQTIDVFLADSSSTTGAGLAGLVYNSAGLTCYYRKGATGSATSITLATQTVGGAWSSGGFVEIDATNMKGIYRFDVPNTVIDTEGYATVYFRGAANLVPTALRIDCRPLPADVKKLLGTAWLVPAVAGTPDVNTKTITDGAITAASIATDAIDADALKADAVTEIQSGLATAANLATVAGYLDTEIAAIISTLGTAGAGLTDLGGMSTTMKAQVQTEADDALIANHLDHLLAVDYDPASKPGVATALLNELIGSDAGVSQFTANALELGPGGSAPTAAQIVDEWESQSQADPTGFHVNVKEVGNTPQTAGDLAALLTTVRSLLLGGSPSDLGLSLLAGGTKRTVRSTAYDNDYGNRIEWSDTYETWPTLTGATITVKIGQGGTALTFTGVVITATGTGKSVGLELTEAQSATISVSDGDSETGWRYLVYATIGTDDIALAEGQWISSAQPT